MRIRSSFLSLTALSSVLLLGACGYSMESSNQDITFLSPEAEDVKCLVYVDKRKYQVFPPESINIKKSPKDMEVTCHAPGNRIVELTVPAKFESKAIWGSPGGMAWDYASKSLHYYPEVIAVDFSQEVFLPNEPPNYENDDMMSSEEHDLEEFKPSQLQLNKDKFEVDTPLMRKDDIIEEELIEIEELVEPRSDKGDLESVLEELRETPTEILKEAENADSEPVELFPGQ